MPTLTVWKYDTDTGAPNALSELIDPKKQELITVLDAATVNWPIGASKPRTEQLRRPVSSATLGGALLGLLLGIIFSAPILGMAAGVMIGALLGALTHVGVDDAFIAAARTEVTPGTSALFLLSPDGVPERLRQQMSDHRGHLIASNLTAGEDTQLREVFAEDT
ncbi:MAG: DUF1269 domain-containing protein [Acidimicrobiales bacterium]